MGVTEETGQTARTAIGALTSVPGLLVLVMLSIGTLAAAAWIWHEQDKSRSEIMKEIITRCFPVNRGPIP